MLFLSTAGHLPQQSDGTLLTGKVGSEVTSEEAYDAAKLVALNIIGTLKGKRH